MAISVIFKNPSAATFVALLVMLFQLLFGGLLLSKREAPDSAQWIYNFSFFDFAFEALSVNEFNGLTLVEKKLNLNIEVQGEDILRKESVLCLIF